MAGSWPVERESPVPWRGYTYLQANLNGLAIARLLQSAPPFDHMSGGCSQDNHSCTLIAADDLSPETNLCAKYVIGYRSGGFNTAQLAAARGP
jgi:hypothetical protein